eukprot:7379456-Pyramimonas_sp.AAC.1
MVSAEGYITCVLASDKYYIHQFMVIHVYTWCTQKEPWCVLGWELSTLYTRTKLYNANKKHARIARAQRLASSSP